MIQTKRVKNDNRRDPKHHEILLVQASNQTGVVSSTLYTLQIHATPPLYHRFHSTPLTSRDIILYKRID